MAEDGRSDLWRNVYDLTALLFLLLVVVVIGGTGRGDRFVILLELSVKCLNKGDEHVKISNGGK